MFGTISSTPSSLSGKPETQRRRASRDYRARVGPTTPKQVGMKPQACLNLAGL